MCRKWYIEQTHLIRRVWLGLIFWLVSIHRLPKMVEQVVLLEPLPTLASKKGVIRRSPRRYQWAEPIVEQERLAFFAHG